jgi:hypothetical protein
MRFSTAFVLVLLATSFPAQAEPPVARAEVAPPITELILERGPCFGTCPHYRITLRSDGTGTYTGWSYVERPGVHTGRFSPEAFMRLAREIDDLGFWQLRESYLHPVNDLPVMRTVALRADGSRKVVRDHGAVGVPAVEGPAALLRVQTAIDRFAAEVAWEPTSETPGLWRVGAP